MKVPSFELIVDEFSMYDRPICNFQLILADLNWKFDFLHCLHCHYQINRQMYWLKLQRTYFTGEFTRLQFTQSKNI